MSEEKIIRKELQSKFQRTVCAQERVGEWSTFEGFYNWAMEAGYRPGYTLKRRTTAEGFSPENCYFASPTCQPAVWGEEQADFIRRWNKAVNPLRRLAGLPPFPGPVAGDKK